MTQPGLLANLSPRRRFRLAFYGFLLVGVIYLLLEHTAHTLGALPYLLFLACPLMHLFMHSGHGHGHSGCHQGADHSETSKTHQS
jgi:hypothetical protein